MTLNSKLGLTLAALAALGLTASQAAQAQTLIDRYSFDTTADFAGSSPLTAGSNISFTFSSVGYHPTFDEAGTTVTGGGNNVNNYYSFQGASLTNLVNSLKATTSGSTFEFFLGATSQNNYSPLFAFGSGTGGGTGSSGKYEILTAYRDGNQIGAGASILNGYNNESGAKSSTAVAPAQAVAPGDFLALRLRCRHIDDLRQCRSGLHRCIRQHA